MKVVEEKQTGKGENNLINEFKNALKTDIHNLNVAALMGFIDEQTPDVLPNGYRSIYSQAILKARQEKKNKDDAFFDFLLRESVRQALLEINEIIALHQKQLEELLQEINDTSDALNLLDKQHYLLEKELKYFEDNGFFDLDENGELKNKEAEAIISDWETKNGQTIDRSDSASYETIFFILVSIEEERVQLRGNIKNYTTAYEHHKQQLEEAEKIKAGLESDDPDQNVKALLEFEKLKNGFGHGFENNISEKEELLVEVKNEIELLETDSENLDEDFSFGFPPLQNDFTNAVTANKNLSETPSIKKTSLPTTSAEIKLGR